MYDLTHVCSSVHYQGCRGFGQLMFRHTYRGQCLLDHHFKFALLEMFLELSTQDSSWCTGNKALAGMQACHKRGSRHGRRGSQISQMVLECSCVL